MEQSTNLNPRILILDDDYDFQTLIEESFKPKGYSITGFGDPSEVWNRLKTEPNYLSNFDLVLTDLRMPKISGMEFLVKCLELAPETPIILMTATNRVALAVEAIQAGAYDFIVKPISMAQLGLSIDRALALKTLRKQNRILKSCIKSTWSFNGIIGKSAAMQSVFDMGRRVANSSTNVLIYGESGTGKEVMAKAIHQSGSRAKSPFVAINCSAIPEALLENELFGHAKGAFTGATDKKIGLFEEANGGTLFLDEIADLNFGLQAKLLRVLQERKIKRVGENIERDIDVRILAATHGDLKTEVKNKKFREDLYFRLNVIQIHIPALRNRKEDIIPLAQYFFEKFSAQNKCSAKTLSSEALEHLLHLPWQGNVRELENVIERAVILTQSESIQISDLGHCDDEFVAAQMPSVYKKSEDSDLEFSVSFKDHQFLTMQQLSTVYARFVLLQSNGVKEQARRILDIDRKTLSRKLLIEPIDAQVPAFCEFGSGSSQVSAH